MPSKIYQNILNYKELGAEDDEGANSGAANNNRRLKSAESNDYYRILNKKLDLEKELQFDKLKEFNKTQDFDNNNKKKLFKKDQYGY